MGSNTLLMSTAPLFIQKLLFLNFLYCTLVSNGVNSICCKKQAKYNSLFGRKHGKTDALFFDIDFCDPYFDDVAYLDNLCRVLDETV